VLGHPDRLLILCRIAQSECAVAGLQRELGLRQPGLSQHLAELRDCGLVQTRRAARSVFYSLKEPRIAALLEVLQGYVSGAEAPVPQAAPQQTEPARVAPVQAAFFARLE